MSSGPHAGRTVAASALGAPPRESPSALTQSAEQKVPEGSAPQATLLSLCWDPGQH